MMLIRTRLLNITRRGAFLALFGIVYVLLGYSFLNIEARFKPIVHSQLRFALDVAPIEFYGWAWIAAGLLAVLGGLIHRLDGLGFAAGVFMPAVWSIAYFIAQYKDHVPRSWVGGTVYAVFAGAMWIVSGMVDPLDLTSRPRRWRSR